MGNEVITDVELKDVSDSELKANGVVALATRPNAPSRYGEGGLTAEDLKARFDRLAGILADRINIIHKFLKADDLDARIKITALLDDEGKITLSKLGEDLLDGTAAAKYIKVYDDAKGLDSLQQVITDILTRASTDAEENEVNFRNLNVRADGFVQRIVIDTIVSLETITVRLTRYSDKGDTLGSEEFGIPNAPYLINVHNNSEEAHADIRSAVTKNADNIQSLGNEIDDVRDIANGRVRARAFDDWNSAMVTIAGYSYDATLTDFAIGDQIYIRQSEAPDAWVSGFSTAFEAYPGGNVNVDPFSEGQASLHVGYLILSPLEAPDVDFSDYATKDEVKNYADKAEQSVAEVKESTENAVKDAKDYVDESVTEAKAYVNEAINSFDPPSADKVDRLEAQVANLTAQIAPEYFETDASVAYMKSVPADSLPYAEVIEVGGMSYAKDGEIKSAAVTAIESVGENLWSLGDISGTQGKILTVYFPAGTYTIGFIATSEDTDRTECRLLIQMADGTSEAFYPPRNERISYTFTASSTITLIEMDASSSWADSEGDSFTFSDIMLNRGETALPYAPYVKHTLPIPAEVQALEGWGWGTDAKNYNRLVWDVSGGVKAYRQEVSSIDLGALSWTAQANNVFNGSFSLIAPPAYYPERMSGVLVADYANSTAQSIADMPDKSILRFEWGVAIRDTAYTDAAAFKEAMNGKTMLYARKDPVVTDLPTVLDDNNFVKVEGGGTITAENEHGLAAPTTVIYQKKEATA